MADRPVILQIKQVVKNFGNVHAVNGVNLNIHEGEFLPYWDRQVVERRHCFECWQASNFHPKEVSRLMGKRPETFPRTSVQSIWYFSRTRCFHT